MGFYFVSRAPPNRRLSYALGRYIVDTVFLTCIADWILNFPFKLPMVGTRRIQQTALERRGTMKRPIKPFVVEVRKGLKSPKKKTSSADLPPLEFFEEQPRESDALRRAEAALFGVFAAKPDTSSTSGRSGRILETIPDEAPPHVAPPAEGKRRGRPPGSLNKPKDMSRERAKERVDAADQAPTAPKRRGRPPRVLEGAVRKVELTPELANAALESIAKASVTRAPLPTRPAPNVRMASSPAKPPRALKRAGKEKLLKEKSIKVKALKEKRLKLNAPATGRASIPMPESAPTYLSPAPAIWPKNPLDTLPRLIRVAVAAEQGDPGALMAALQRPRAGQRWKRRLRGAALFAYERRQRKTSAAPR